MTEAPLQLTYYQTRRLNMMLDGKAVAVYSKPGIPDWEHISPACELLAEHVKLGPGDNVLLFGGGNAALAVSLAEQLTGGKLWVTGTSLVALDLTAQTLELNRASHTHVNCEPSLLPKMAGVFNTTVMSLPKGRKLARRWLVEVYELLKPSGRLFLAGDNREGIQPVIKDATALFGKAVVLGYKKGNRVACLEKNDPPLPKPEWAGEAGIYPGTWYEYLVEIRGSRLRVRSLPGIFSYDRLDEGTRLLLDHLTVSPGSRVLDFGCGSGMIGLFSALWGAASVDLIDADLAAVAAARENISINGIHIARAFPSDVLQAVEGNRYDLILSNPPFHTGKEVDYEITRTFIAHAQNLLEPGGQLIVVANKFIRYNRLMGELFKKVDCLVETGKYHVLSARK